MKSFLKIFSDFYQIQKFFSTKKFYLIFFLYLICTLLETINIAIIVPAINYIFIDQNIVDQFIFIKYLGISKISFQNNTVYYLSTFIIFIFLIKSIILIISCKIQTDFFSSMRFRITSFFFNFYIKKPYVYFLNKEKNTSKIIRNVTMLSSSYSSFLERFLLLANDFFVFLGVIIFMLIKDPVFFLIVFFLILFFSFGFILITKKKFFTVGKKLLDLSSNLIKDVQEVINNIIQIKILKKEYYFLNTFNLKAKENSYKIGKLSFLQTLPRILLEFFAILFLFSIISFMFLQSISKEEIFSTITILTLAIIRIIPLSTKFISFFNSVSSFAPSLEVLKKEINSLDKMDDGKNETKEAVLNNKIEKINLEKVFFKYPDTDKKILEDISIELNQNNIYGICGESGSGKTTLVNLICGLLKPSSGSIKFNNANMISKFSSSIAYVSQNSYFQNNTIKNNIAFGINDKEIDDQRIYESLKKVNLFELVYSLENKLETYINELGSNFSGGQLQRLSIARAIYANSDLIIFDEPTSSLDRKTKTTIMNSIAELRDKKIILIISHSIEDMSICSSLFKIENKKIIKIND